MNYNAVVRIAPATLGLSNVDNICFMSFIYVEVQISNEKWMKIDKK